MSQSGDKNNSFIYLLNAMERAAMEEHPAEHGYAKKREAVLRYVADLEAIRSATLPIKELREIYGLLLAKAARGELTTCERTVREHIAKLIDGSEVTR